MHSLFSSTKCYTHFATGFGLEIDLRTSGGVPNGLNKIGGYLIGKVRMVMKAEATNPQNRSIDKQVFAAIIPPLKFQIGPVPILVLTDATLVVRSNSSISRMAWTW